MCLEIKENSKVKIAEKDITCYKICLCKTERCKWSLKNFFGNKTAKFYKTPFCYADVEIGKKYQSYLLASSSFSINEGLHSFVENPNGKSELYLCNYDVIIKCVIPKGASYYEGIQFNLPGYASSEILYVEFLEERKRKQ